jgi:hypothetical protein
MEIFIMRHITTCYIPIDREHKLLDTMVEMCLRGSVTDVAFICWAIPQGDTDPLPRARLAAEQFVRIRKKLEPHGIRAGILLQATSGHGERWETLSPVTFQRITGWDGTESPTCFCCLDKDFLNFVQDTVEELAKAEPAFFMLEDDARTDNHGVAHSCMCPLHVARFNKKTGNSYSREQITELMSLDSPEGLKIRNHWFDGQVESIVEFAEHIRVAIDRKSPDIPCCGNVIACRDAMDNQQVIRALAGNTKPMARLHPAFYCNGGPKFLASCLAKNAMHRSVYDDNIEFLCEADSFPQTLYSMSCKTLKAFITGTITAAGVSVPYTWIPNSDEWISQDWQAYADTMGLNHKFFGMVWDVTKNTDWDGPSSICLPDIHRCKPWNPSDPAFAERLDWTSEVCGLYGVSSVVNNMEAPVKMVHGDAAWTLDDITVRNLLKGGLLLDGEAADVLCRRGYSELLGVKLHKNDESSRGNRETINSHPLNGGAAGKNLMSIRQPNSYYIEVLNPELQVLSCIHKTLWRGHPESEPVAAISVGGPTSSGGRIAIFGQRLSGGMLEFYLNSNRKQQLISILNYLGNKAVPYVDTNVDVWTQIGCDRENGHLVAVIINLSNDDINPLTLILPGINPGTVKMIMQDGSLKKIPVVWNGDRLQTELCAETLQPIILSISISS